MTEKEYNVCVDQYADRLYRFIIKNIRLEEEARDIVQNSFEILWRKHQSISFEKARSYLFTTAYHNLIDQVRKQKRIEQLEQLPEKAEMEETNVDLKRVLEEGMSRLKEIQRTLLMLKDYEGYSYKEIGEITGLSTDQVRVYLHRARLKMKAYLVKMENVL